MAPQGEQEDLESVMEVAAVIWIFKDRQALEEWQEGLERQSNVS
jgi:hypothetical protein